MKQFVSLKYFLAVALIGIIAFGCIDNVPEAETLPSAAVAFTYKVIDDSYQYDYYVGAEVEFSNTSFMQGECVWDFGDGNTKTGDVVTHKYPVAGTYQVKLTVDGAKSKIHPIMISDIVPIMSVDEIEGGLCEVLTTPINILMELPNPEGLEEEYLWIFPSGTTDENDNAMTTSTEKNPGKLKFGNVGSQAVRLQVKLGGRQLQEGRVNVQVGYNKEVPTLYYAVKNGNIMALKLINDAPAGMQISPYDMGVSSGKHPLNILFNDQSLYILDAGQQFTYVDDSAGNLGDGRIMVMAKDGSRMETMLTNSGAAFDDPYYGYIEGDILYFTDRNTGIRTANLKERNRSYTLADFPYKVQNATLGYYANGWSYGAMNACIGKVDGTWYWCKTYNGYGMYRFSDGDILPATITGGKEAPKAGVALSSMSPKSFVWDKSKKILYFSIYDAGFEGFYGCTIDQLNEVESKGALAAYKKTTATNHTVTPITEPGLGEGSSGEFIGICQMAIDEATGDVYFGLRSAYPDEVKSGLMRYNATTGKIEHVIEGIEVYGVSINNSKSKLF